MIRPTRHLVFSSVTIVAIVLAGCGGGGGTTSPTATPSTSAADAVPATSDRCDSRLDDALSQWADVGFTGTVATYDGGDLVCTLAYGVADPDSGRPMSTDTVFSIGSVTKTLTAAAIVGLVADGRLDLDDAVGAVLPDLTGPASDLTIAQLLVHTSGLSGSIGEDREEITAADAIERLGDLPLAFEPGTDHLYSNAGYTLLALVVEELTGSYRDHLLTTTLAPADPNEAGFWDGERSVAGPRAVGQVDGGVSGFMGTPNGPRWALDGAGGLAMTTERLARWVSDLGRGSVVPADAVALVQTPRWDVGDGQAEAPGWVVIDPEQFGETVLGTAGGGDDIGHNTAVAWMPDSDRVIAISSSTADVLAEQLLGSILPDIVAGRAPTAPRPTEEVDQAETASLAGTYRLGDGSAIVIEPGERGPVAIADGAGAIDVLFAPVPGFDPSDYDAHEAAAAEFLAGATPSGAAEREMLEDALGAIETIEIVGTVFAEIELRTYAVLTTDTGDEIRLWLALDDRGGLAAMLLEVPPPRLELGRDGDAWVPVDAGVPVPPVELRFDGERLTVTGPTRSTEATRR